MSSHRHVGVAAQVEGGQGSEDGQVGGREGALQVVAAHVQAQQSSIGGADLARVAAPVGEQLAALAPVARLPVAAHRCRAHAAAAEGHLFFMYNKTARLKPPKVTIVRRLQLCCTFKGRQPQRSTI